MNLSGYGCSKMLLWVISSLLLINLASISYAESECDQLAALEADPLSVSAPVNFADLKAEKVTAACSKDHNSRFWKLPSLWQYLLVVWNHL